MVKQHDAEHPAFGGVGRSGDETKRQTSRKSLGGR